MTRDQIEGLILTVFSLLTGGLVAHGYLTTTQQTTLGGAVAAIALTAWSIYTNRSTTAKPAAPAAPATAPAAPAAPAA